MNKLKLAVIAALALFAAPIYAQTSGGVTSVGTIHPGDISVFKNKAQIQALTGTPLSGQCAVYTGTYPNGSWGPASCAAGGAGTVTNVALTTSAGTVTLTGTCSSVTIVSCAIDLTPTIVASGVIGDAAHTVALSYDQYGRLLTTANNAIAITFANVSGTLPGAQFGPLTGDVTTSSYVATIANNVVTNAKLAQGAALTLKGNATNALANETDIPCTASGSGVYHENGAGALTCSVLGNLNIGAASLGYSRFPTALANTFVGNTTSAAASIANYNLPSCSTVTQMLQYLSNTGFQCGTLGTVTAGTGISVTGTAPNYTVSNTSSLTAGAGISVTGTAPNYTVANSAPGRVLLNTLTAASSASLQDTTSFANGYGSYTLEFENVVPATANVNCTIQVHTAGAFPVTGYLSSTLVSSGAATVGTSVTNGIPCDYSNTISATAGYGISGTVTVMNVASTNRNKIWNGYFSMPNSGNSLFYIVTIGGAYQATQAAIDGFSIQFASGNIASGVIRVYGQN